MAVYPSQKIIYVPTTSHPTAQSAVDAAEALCSATELYTIQVAEGVDWVWEFTTASNARYIRVIPMSIGRFVAPLRPTPTYTETAIDYNSGTTYWIDPTNGDDVNDGTENSPWQTVDGAESAATAGDIIKIKAGTHDMGSSTITFNAALTWVADGGDVILTNSNANAGFVVAPGNAAVRFEGITFRRPALQTSQKLMQLDTTTAISNKVFYNCIFDGTLSACDDYMLYINNGVNQGAQVFATRFTNCQFNGGASTNRIVFGWADRTTVLTGSESLIFQGCTFSRTVIDDDPLVELRDMAGIKIYGCTFNETFAATAGVGGQMVYIYCSESSPGASDSVDRSGTIEVTDNTFYRKATRGLVIQIGGNNIAEKTDNANKFDRTTIARNRIYGPWYFNPAVSQTSCDVHAILVGYSSNCDISHNIICGSWIGVVLKGTTSAGADDTGCWKFRGGVHHNVFYNNIGPGYYEKGVKNVRMWNNTFYSDVDVSTTGSNAHICINGWNDGTNDHFGGGSSHERNIIVSLSGGNNAIPFLRLVDGGYTANADIVTQDGQTFRDNLYYSDDPQWFIVAGATPEVTEFTTFATYQAAFINSDKTVPTELVEQCTGWGDPEFDMINPESLIPLSSLANGLGAR